MQMEVVKEIRIYKLPRTSAAKGETTRDSRQPCSQLHINKLMEQIQKVVWLLGEHINVESLGKHRVLVTLKLHFHLGAVFNSDTLLASQGNCTLHVPPCDLLQVIAVVQVTA